MYSSGIFIFGSKLFEIPRQDAITSLPLELSWKIFLYLDDASLRSASYANKTWSRIIMSHKKLRSRFDYFELALKLGSRKLAQFYKANKKIMRKCKKNYLPIAGDKVETTKVDAKKAKTKRVGEEIINHKKRFRIF